MRDCQPSTQIFTQSLARAIAGESAFFASFAGFWGLEGCPLMFGLVASAFSRSRFQKERDRVPNSWSMLDQENGETEDGGRRPPRISWSPRNPAFPARETPPGSARWRCDRVEGFVGPGMVGRVACPTRSPIPEVGRRYVVGKKSSGITAGRWTKFSKRVPMFAPKHKYAMPLTGKDAQLRYLRATRGSRRWTMQKKSKLAR